MKEIILIIFLTTTSMYGQSSFVSAGGSSAEEKESVSFSLGQVFCHSFNDDANKVFVTEGVQQTYELLVAELNNEDPELAFFKNENIQEGISTISENIQMKVFPNPVTQYLTIGLEEEADNIEYAIYNLSGQLMSSRKIVNTTTKVDLTSIIDGVYIMRIVKNNTLLKSFKIIKNQI